MLLGVPFVLLQTGKLVYEIGDRRLRVRGPLGWVSFSLRGRRARGYTPRRLWRVFGIGMPGYWVGRFRDGAALRVYASRVRDGVLLDGEPRVYLTPADSVGFVEALREQGVSVDGET